MKLLLLPILAALVSAAAVDFDVLARAAGKGKNDCYTVGNLKGYLTVSNKGEIIPLGLNKKHKVTYGAHDPRFLVEFQACPKTGKQYPNLTEYTGQIRVPSTGSDSCLTVNKLSEKDATYFMSVVKCKSSSLPPASQFFEYSPDFGVFWMGPSKGDEVGYVVPSEGEPTPQTQQGTHLLKVGCSKACASFAITPKKK